MPSLFDRVREKGFGEGKSTAVASMFAERDLCLRVHRLV